MVLWLVSETRTFAYKGSVVLPDFAIRKLLFWWKGLLERLGSDLHKQKKKLLSKYTIIIKQAQQPNNKP